MDVTDSYVDHTYNEEFYPIIRQFPKKKVKSYQEKQKNNLTATPRPATMGAQQRKPMTTPETLARIEKKYPEAFKALPKGYRFLNIGEKLAKNDKCWIHGNGPFESKVNFYGTNVREDHHPIIRRVRSKKNPLNTTPKQNMKYNLPAWPAHIKKNDDFVYIGNGRKGGIPGLYDTKSIAKGSDATDLDISVFCNWFGSDLSGHYFVKKDDPFLKQFEIKAKNKMPAHLPPVPEGYIYLGELDKINVPPSWSTGNGYKDQLSDFAWYNKDFGWCLVSGRETWLSVAKNYYIAAKPNSPLYLLNNKPKETLKSLKAEIEKLKGENEKLKAKIEFVKKGLS